MQEDGRGCAAPRPQEAELKSFSLAGKAQTSSPPVTGSEAQQEMDISSSGVIFRYALDEPVATPERRSARLYAKSPHVCDPGRVVQPVPPIAGDGGVKRTLR